ncbi:MAG: hypothetical protein M5U09_04550 [Gammaproteobacteria bacterium]|nr:hypothetical protein [Gammaproteobacteria bacterium]
MIGDARGIGAFHALEFVKDRDTREPLVPWYGADNAPIGKLAVALRREGVYAFGRYNVLLVTPPSRSPRTNSSPGSEALDRALRVLA